MGPQTVLRRQDDSPILRCPECYEKYGGYARIGNRKSRCRTCNRFAQAVRRETLVRLKDMHREDYLALRAGVESDLYLGLVKHQKEYLQ